MIDNFKRGYSIDSISDFTGSQNKTGDTEKYLRLFWEVSKSKVSISGKWVHYAKGGPFRRWAGNACHVIDWSDDAKKFYQDNRTSTLLPERYRFREGITYNMITSGRAHFRYLKSDMLFDIAAPSAVSFQRDLYPYLALLNSSVAQKYFDVINPTLNMPIGVVNSFPILEGADSDRAAVLSRDCCRLSYEDWDSQETSWDFIRSRLVE